MPVESEESDESDESEESEEPIESETDCDSSLPWVSLPADTDDVSGEEFPFSPPQAPNANTPVSAIVRQSAAEILFKNFFVDRGVLQIVIDINYLY